MYELITIWIILLRTVALIHFEIFENPRET